MTLGLHLGVVTGLTCSLCGRLRDSEVVAETLVSAALFGRLLYAVCPCCQMEVHDHEDPEWRRKVRVFLYERDGTVIR